jgi:membrane protein involved in colicin uptake
MARLEAMLPDASDAGRAEAKRRAEELARKRAMEDTSVDDLFPSDSGSDGAW